MKFILLDSFIEKYKRITPPFGFNGLGELVYLRTYSRIKSDGNNERWFETVRRVVEGTFNLQKKWIENSRLEWIPSKAQKSAQEMYDRIFNMKFLPPGRGLWAMGSSITEERKLYMALNNCSFVSTQDIKNDLSKSFCFLMDVSMLGVGCGFDVKGAGEILIHKPHESKENILIIEDTREDWVESIRLILNSFFIKGQKEIYFDYSKIRKEGELIKGFGGLSSGPKPLMELHNEVREILTSCIDKHISVRNIVDIMNLIGKCVVAGNVRRTAEIVFGNYNSEEYLDLKDYKKNPKREQFGWTSNNSVFCDIGMDYGPVSERTKNNGEPGYAWLENMQGYSRMNNGKDNKDHRVTGGNPCQPKWATVLTKNGISTIGQIKIGDEIWSETGWTKIINKWSTGIKRVVEYQTTAGVFHGTENHKLVSKGKKIEAKYCQTIDLLSGNYDYQNKVTYNIQDIMDGLVIGDGTVHKASNNLVNLCVGKNDGDYFFSEIKDLLIKHRPGLHDYAYEIQTTITCNELPLTFDRRVPDRFFYGDTIKVRSFLRGLYSANGSICGNRITLKASSFNLIKQVNVMLSSIGIRSYYTINKPTTVKFSNGQYECKQSYDLNINADKEKFYNIVGFLQLYKKDKLKSLILQSKPIIRNKDNYKIISAQEVSNEEVFDITLDNLTHTYWTGGVNVSNCLEQSLESYEVCNLVETFPCNHASLDDFLITLKYAYLYAKTVTLGETHWPDTNRVMLRNRRIGCSMSGLAQFITSKGLNELKIWCEEGYKSIEYYDTVYSDWFAIPKSIKKTSIKPSGTVSLLAGATPGVHFPESNFYIRRIRISKNSTLVAPLKESGYKVEPCFGSEDSTLVVEIPVKVGDKIRSVKEISIWEQAALAAFLQKYWADNQVSCTISFQQQESNQIKSLLNYYQYQLKGISFLPIFDNKNTPYKQMPYEEITENRYNELMNKISKVKFKHIRDEEAEVEKFCNSDVCLLKT